MIKITYFIYNETGLKIFLGSCWEHGYKFFHSQSNFLSAILIFFKNIAYFFKLLFFELLIFTKFESDHLQTVLTKSHGFCDDRQNSFCIAPQFILGMMPKWLWGSISAKLWHIDSKLCACHCHLKKNTQYWFDNHLLVKNDNQLNNITSGCIYAFWLKSS